MRDYWNLSSPFNQLIFLRTHWTRKYQNFTGSIHRGDYTAILSTNTSSSSAGLWFPPVMPTTLCKTSQLTEHRVLVK